MKNIKTLLFLAIASFSINSFAMTGRNAQKVAYKVSNIVAHAKLTNIAPQAYDALAIPTQQFTKNQNYLALPYVTPTNNNNVYGKLAAGILAASLATTVAYAEDQEENDEKIIKTITLKNGNQCNISTIISTGREARYYNVYVKDMTNNCVAAANFKISKISRNEQGAWIYLIFVYPQYRNQKIGSEIIHTIIEIAKSEKCTTVGLQSVNNSRRFYETLDFIADKKTFLATLFSDSNCDMEKKL